MLRVQEGRYDPVLQVDERADYHGARIRDSTFSRNTATTIAGGAVASKQSFLWVYGSTFEDNVAVAAPGEAHGRGSALDIAFEAVFQRTHFSTSAETTRNGTMVEAFRAAFDSCTFGEINDGIAVNLNQDTGTLDSIGRVGGKTYPILSRNTNMSGVRVASLFGSGGWDWMRCAKNGERDIWYYDNDIPSLVTEGVLFTPACPSTALCEDDLEARTMRCTCRPTDYHADVINTDMACTLGGATFSPTPQPQVPVQGPFVVIDSGPNQTFFLTENEMLAFNGLVAGLVQADWLYPEAADAMFGLLGILAAALICTLLVDCARFSGVSADEREGRLLWAMAKAPGIFHILTCTDRAQKRAWVEAYQDEEEVEAGKKKKKKKKKKGGAGPVRSPGGSAFGADTARMNSPLLAAGTPGRSSWEETKEGGGRLAGRKSARSQATI